MVFGAREGCSVHIRDGIAVLRRGLPVALTEISQDLHLLVAQAAATLHSTYAAGTVGLMITMLSVLVSPILLSISSCLLANISTHVHHGSTGAAKRALCIGLLLSISVTCCSTAVLWIALGSAGLLFSSDKAEQELIQATVDRTSLAACGTCILWSIGHPLRSALHSQGRSAETVWVSAVLASVLVVAAIRILTSTEGWGGAYATWLGLGLAELSSAAFLGCVLWRTDWEAEAERAVRCEDSQLLHHSHDDCYLDGNANLGTVELESLGIVSLKTRTHTNNNFVTL